MIEQGTALWLYAVSRAQGRGPPGTLPRSDDRALYWARLQMQAALAQWTQSFALTADQLASLSETLEEWSRGEHEIGYPTGPNVRRLIMSGFDPFTLDAGPNGNGIRTGNPRAPRSYRLTVCALRTPTARPSSFTPTSCR